MKLQVKLGVPVEKLRSIVPPAFRGTAFMLPSSSSFDVLLFGHGTNDVSHSSVVAKALASVEASGCKIVAVGRNFTHEALELLEARGAFVLRLSDFPWSDARHEEIKVWGGARVKRPALLARPTRRSK